MSQFHALTISDIRRETPDCVSIAFRIPPELSALYRFEAGQNVTLRARMGDEEIRRSYSICSSPMDNELRVAIKHQFEGRFSSHANHQLKIGDQIEVLPPTGRFTSKPDPTRARNYLAYAAGSGITPVISLIKTILAAEPTSTFTLVYGNRTRNSIIFKEELEGLKNRYIDRFIIHFIFSREITDAPVHHGRIDAEKCKQLSASLINVNTMDHIFICGPEQMIFSVRDWLLQKGVAKEKIHFELFTVPGEKTKQPGRIHTDNQEKTSQVNIRLDGRTISFQLPFDGSSVLEGALARGADLPFACKGGVCATCRAKLISGEVDMDNNYALEEDELAAGYILTCQSHPRSEQVDIDFDAK